MMTKKRTKGKLNRGYGMSDYYNFFIRTYGNDITQKKYNDIISDFNKEIINLIIEEQLEYHMPYLQSNLSVRKIKRVPKIKDGKLYNPNPIDWVTTNKLWSEDEEAKEKKLLVRFLNNHTSGYVYMIYFKKYDDKRAFRNKKFYNFKTNREFARTLGARIKDQSKEVLNAYLLY